MLHNFDTHQIIKNFVKSGFKEAQAEVIVKTISDSRDNDLSHLATKMDVANIENRLLLKIADVESRLSLEVANVKTEMLKWFIGINVTLGVAYISTMIACFKFFIN